VLVNGGGVENTIVWGFVASIVAAVSARRIVPTGSTI
jgi:hypothetical protein